MDAEKFDKVVLDLLYDELDELTRASAIRHTEQSGRAKALYAELRATREVGALPLVEPPEDLEARILAAEELARAERPLRQRLGTVISIAASYAMRPQLGMAAVLLLMVGSSLLLLRVKPGEPRSVQVTEHGVPESERESVAVVPVPMPAPATPMRESEPAVVARAPSQPRPVADSPRAAAPEESEELAAAGKASEVASDSKQFATPPSEPVQGGTLGEGAPPAALDKMAGAGAPAGPSMQRRAKDDEAGGGGASPGGCEASVRRYEAWLLHPSSPGQAGAVRWAAAECYVELGRIERARQSFTLLLSVPGYADRAERALSQLPPKVATAGAASAPSSEPAKPGSAAPAGRPAKAAPAP
jgi:hypothetical protein